MGLDSISGYAPISSDNGYDSSFDTTEEKKYYVKGKTYTKDQFDKLCIIRYTNLTPYSASDGDTLESISEKFGVDVSKLKQLNIFNNFEKIKAGDLFQLPIEISSQIDEIYNSDAVLA